MDMCSLAQLFAACRVLLRLPVPGHPPCALVFLTFAKNFEEIFSNRRLDPSGSGGERAKVGKFRDVLSFSFF